MKQRVFSGIQPSGNLHIGNYLGALRRWVAQQNETDNYFCIVNLHAITLPQDPAELREKTRELAALYFAAGIDPRKSTVFIQSQQPAHAQLTWILNCMTPMGWLERMTQFKDKASKNKERAGVGLFDYPVLMAADILLYQAQLVPVGDDQRQHVELARDLAIRFNNRFGQTFVVPEATFGQAGARIMSLGNPAEKMSKSDPDQQNIVRLLDSPDAIRRKIARAKTDPGHEVRFDPARPGVSNLLEIYQAITREPREAIEAHFEGKGYADLKRDVADAVIAELEPLQARFRELTAAPGYLDGLLREGLQRAAVVADKTLADVMQKVGLS